MKKKKQKSNNILNIINNSNNFKWKSFCLIILFIIVCLLNIETIKHPYIMMEDGFVFINGFIKDGLISFTFTYGGYLCIASRIIAGISVLFGSIFNSLIVEVQINKLISIFVVCFILNLFNDDRFSFISSNRLIRFAFSIVALLLSSNFLSVMYTNLSMNWWSGIYLILCIMLLLNNDKLKIYEIVLLVVAILSTPFSFIILIPLFFKIIDTILKKNKINKFDIIFYSIITIFIIIQIYSIITSKNVDSASSVSLGISGLFNVIKYALYMSFLSLNYLFTPIYYHFGSTHLLFGLISGFIIFAIMLIISIRKKMFKYFISLCGITFLIYSLTLIKYSANIQPYFLELIDKQYLIWYHLVPAMNVLFCLYLIIGNNILYNKITIGIYCSLFIIVSIILGMNSYKTDLDYVHYIYDINQYINYKSGEYTCVKTPPKWVDWCVWVPVNDDYCRGENNECVKEIQ